MTSPDPLPEDEVRAFLREARQVAKVNASQLQELGAQREAAAGRLSAIRQRVTLGASADLVDELIVRDEELRAVTDNLVQQIEAMHRASALLERERAKYVDLFARAPDAYLVTDVDGTIDEANLAAATLFRTERSFLTGRALVTFVARQDTGAFRAFLRAASRVGLEDAEAQRAVFRMRPRGDAVFVVFVRTTLLTRDDGRPLGLRWSLRQFDADESATGGAAALAELASGMATELQAPLSPIIEWARCLHDGVSDEGERRRALGWIEKSALAQKAKLDELTELARIYRESASPVVVDLAEAVEHAIASLGAESSRVTLQSHVGPREARVLASGVPRALELLLERAIAATPVHGSAVLVRLRAHRSDVLVEIETPGEARTTEAWSIRTAIATRIVERAGGRVLLSDTSPSTRLRFPRVGA